MQAHSPVGIREATGPVGNTRRKTASKSPNARCVSRCSRVPPARAAAVHTWTLCGAVWMLNARWTGAAQLQGSMWKTAINVRRRSARRAGAWPC